MSLQSGSWPWAEFCGGKMAAICRTYAQAGCGGCSVWTQRCLGLPYGKRVLFSKERGVLGCGIQHHQELRLDRVGNESSSFAGSKAEDDIYSEHAKSRHFTAAIVRLLSVLSSRARTFFPEIVLPSPVRQFRRPALSQA